MKGDDVKCLTPAGVGGVAVLRVAGAGPKGRLAEGFSGRLPSPGGIAYGNLLTAGVRAEVLDEVLVIGRSSGHSYEVHTHGSPAVVDEILERLRGGDAETPQAAGLSFAERARVAVPEAPSILGARILLDQAQGAMGEALDQIGQLHRSERAEQLMVLAQRGRGRARLFTPATVVLAGPVNAGKSTLFNVLVGTEAASVSYAPGTTRDALLEEVSLGPWPVHLIDTAGERDLAPALAAGDPRAGVERQGQRIARGLAQGADLVLELCTVEERESVLKGQGPGGPLVVRLVTQAARLLGAEPSRWPPCTVSAQERPGEARETVMEAFVQALGLERNVESLWSPGLAVPFDSRSIEALEEAALAGASGSGPRPVQGLRAEVADATLDALLEQL